MNLISCNKCGVVLDKNKIVFPPIYDKKTDEVCVNNAKWDSDKGYRAFIFCPVCSEPILD